MKIIIIGDLHEGVGADDPLIQTAQKMFLEHVCDYAVTNEIETMIQTGDWFDVRSGIAQNTLQFHREVVHPLLEQAFKMIYVIVGNHDTHYKNSITPNTPFEVLTQPLYTVVQEPMTVSFGTTHWDLVPWVCKGNSDDVYSYIEKSDSDYNVGHWELDGYDFYAGVKSSGADPEFLKHYKKVFSGHYHTSTDRGNVLYVGTPYTLTFGDSNETRGFWVFDTDAESYEFVPNDVCWHRTVKYNKDFDPKIIDELAGKYVRLLIESSDDKLEGTLSQLEERCYKFVHKYLEDFGFDTAEDTVNVKQITVSMTDMVDSMPLDDDDKTAIKKYISSLFSEASAGE